MRSALRQFSRDELGAATVDWVALAAGVLLLGMAVVYFVHQSTWSLVDQITTDLSVAEVPRYGLKE